MKALTLYQPWAWAVGCGVKRVENRSWSPPQPMVGQRIAIHAGKKWDLDSHRALIAGLRTGDPQPPPPELSARGAIIATAVIATVVTTAAAAEKFAGEGQGRWFFGPFGWVLTDLIRVPPVSCRGALGLWRVPAAIELAMKQAAA